MSLADTLTPRQLDIVRLALQELTVKEIAAELGLTYAQVRAGINGWNGIYERLGVRGMVGVARIALEDGMGDTPEQPDARGWQVREGATHWIPEAIPATTSPDNRAWTDYRDDDCQLRRHQPDGCNGSQRVRVASPLFPGARVRVKACEGGWEAVKDG
jgi:DNA-binding CsgD family transcriptional regulator